MLFRMRIDATFAVLAAVALLYFGEPLFSVLAGVVFAALTFGRWTPRKHVPTFKTLLLALVGPFLLLHAAGLALQIAMLLEHGTIAALIAGVLTLAAIAMTSALATRAKYVPF